MLWLIAGRTMPSRVGAGKPGEFWSDAKFAGLLENPPVVPGTYFNDQAALDAAYALDASALPVSTNPPQFGAFNVPAFGTLSGTGADNQWEIRDGDPRTKAGNALYLGHHAAVTGPYELLVGSNNPALPPAGSVG